MSRKVTTADLDGFLARCQTILDAHYRENPRGEARPTLTYSVGRRYARFLLSAPWYPESGSAWAFVDLDSGDVLMPADYDRPAKNARGNLFDEKQGTGRIDHLGPARLR